jgi:hypothetical protein
MKKMRTVILGVLVASALCCACKKQTKKEDTPAVCAKPTPVSLDKYFKTQKGTEKAKTEVTVRCNGDCNPGGKCTVQGVPGRGNTVECSCGNCTMQVTTVKTDSAGATDTLVVNLIDATMNVDYLEKLRDYMALNYPGDDYSISKITIINDPFFDVYIVQYEYLTATGETGTITYENDEEGKNIQIDCKGKCSGGCKEQIDPSNLKVSCSCVDCSLEIKVIADTK